MMEPGQYTGLRDVVPVISFKALLAMKLHALKDGDARDHKDLIDLRMLLRYSPNSIFGSE
jgi:predicted nucleotidyltransferase